MIAYFDSSATAKLLLADEPDAAAAKRVWDEADRIVTSAITQAEVHAALAAARRARRIGSATLAMGIRALATSMEVAIVIDVSFAVCRLAGELAEEHRLRGADAIHLATAVVDRPSAPLFATWDRDLALAARREGLAVAGPA